jgi:hypothetical protein
MRVTALTAGFFLTTALMSLAWPALADGCGDACDCPTAKARPHQMVTSLPAHPVAPVVHHVVRRMARPRMAGNYYNYAAAGAVRQGYGHGEWRVAPNDGQVPQLGPMIQAMPGPMAAAGPCCMPMTYAPQPAYYGPPQDPFTHVDDKAWTGGVGYNADNGGGGGGGFMDGFGQVHFANGGGTQNGPTYNDYNESFQHNPSVPGPFVPQRMGAPAPTSTK